MNGSPIIITFNGLSCQVDEGSTIADVLRQHDLSDKPVAVELNLAVIPRSERQRHVLRAGDQVEVVSLIGGG